MRKRRADSRAPIVRIFVSSTFRDMMVERDLLATRVFPRLERYLQEHGWVLEVIDLRWGIPKDAVDDGLVVKACRKQIDNARPFFLGLLGSRYGTRVDALGGVGDHSVTEDEIRYGVFRKQSDLKGSVFLLRDLACVRRVPSALRRDYVDVFDRDVTDLQNLRARISASGVRVGTYSAHWSNTKQALLPDDSFAQMAEQLLRDELRIRLQLDDDAIPEPHARIANAQRVAAARAERRTYCTDKAAEVAEAQLQKSPKGVLRLGSVDEELAYATGLRVLRAKSRRKEEVLAIDGRFWVGDSTPEAFLQFLAQELHALRLTPELYELRGGGAKPRGFREHLESIARSVRRRTTVLLAYPELLVPGRYWPSSDWIPSLEKTRVRLLLVGTEARGVPRFDVTLLEPAEVQAALTSVFAADGRALEGELLQRTSRSAGLQTATGRRLFAETLRSARSTDAVYGRCSELLSFAASDDGEVFIAHCLRLVLGELRLQLGDSVVRSLLPFIATSRTGVLDSDAEALVDRTEAQNAVALARRLRRILDVSEGRLRITGNVGGRRGGSRGTISGEMLARAGAELLRGSTLQQLHAEVATKYGRLQLDVGIRDFVWHCVESREESSLRKAARACMNAAHLARWTRVAPLSEIEEDFRALESAVDLLANGRQLRQQLARWRNFVRSAFERLRDPALDPWQTAHLDDVIPRALAARRTRFTTLVTKPRGASDVSSGRLCAMPDVSNMRFTRAGSDLLMQRAGLIESFDPVSGIVRMSDARAWRQAIPAQRLQRKLRRKRRAPAVTTSFTIDTRFAEPIVHTPRGLRAIPVCADLLAIRSDARVAAVLRDESGVLTCWELAQLASLPPAHELGVFELRNAAELPLPMGTSAPPSAVEIVSWGFDGKRVVYDKGGSVMLQQQVARGAIWRVTPSALGLFLATNKGVIREEDGLQLTRDAAGDIAAHASGKVLAVARETELDRIELFDLSSLERHEGASSLGWIDLPAGRRHGFRALHWLDAERLLIGMMEPDGAEGSVGCWNVVTRRWDWMNELEEHEGLSLVMGMDVAAGGDGVFALTLPLVSNVLVSKVPVGDGNSATTHAALAVHDSGGMLHRVDFSPCGERLTTTDRHGFLEVWRLKPTPMLETRVALPMGALTGYCNLGSSFVLATEGGRIMKYELHDCPRD